MITVTFGSFNVLIFSAKEAGLPSVMSMTLIVGCFWSRAISWALSLGIRFINTPCWWSIYKFDKNFVGMVEWCGMAIEEDNGSILCSHLRYERASHVADWNVIYRAMSPWNITTFNLIGFRSNHVCFPVKVISLSTHIELLLFFLAKQGYWPRLGEMGLIYQRHIPSADRTPIILFNKQ